MLFVVLLLNHSRPATLADCHLGDPRTLSGWGNRPLRFISRQSVCLVTIGRDSSPFARTLSREKVGVGVAQTNGLFKQKNRFI
jgi:hypothetical protein